VTSAVATTVRYEQTLDAYLAGAGETALSEAYELGRQMLCDGISLLDLEALHHKVLQAWFTSHRNADASEATRDAAVFFSEIISSFDMHLVRIDESVAARKRLNESLEEEVKRISLALHSEAGNILAQATLEMELTASSAPRGSQNQLGVMRRLLHEAGERLRELSHELRPSVIDDFGLVPALELLAEGIERRTGVHVNVESNSDRRVAPEIELAVYRVTQEAINNALIHGGASLTIDIRVDKRAHSLLCSISDDGCGFDVASALAPGREPSLGLAGMRERAAVLGGDCEIRSSRGCGTTVEMYIPLY
jgi:signal transduction histidine kinase